MFSKSVLIAFSILILSTFFTFNDIQAQEVPANSVSCPIPGGKITFGSYQANPANGHCGGGYGYTCKCLTGGRRAKAIDIATDGKAAVLPMIGGQIVQWKLITKNYYVNGGEGGGVGNTFEATLGEDKWYLDILHLKPTSIGLLESVPSGTEIAKSEISHIHTTIGKNIKGPVSAASDSDCDPGWLPSDFMCSSSISPPTDITTPTSTPSSTNQSVKSNTVITKVGDPKSSPPIVNQPSEQSFNRPSALSNPEGFVHYCQNDPSWANTCSLAKAGCGPTSMAMVLSTFGVKCNGNTCTPPEVDKFFVSANNRQCGDSLTSMDGGALQSNWLKDLGIETGPLLVDKIAGTLDYGEAKKFIDTGWLIIGSTGFAPSCKCDHIFVVQDVDPQTKTVRVRDPVCGKNANGAYEVEWDYNKIRWSYAYPLRLKNNDKKL